MIDYLNSLRRMRSLSNVTVLLPGHGPAVANPYDKIDEYITHRASPLKHCDLIRHIEDGRVGRVGTRPGADT